MTRPRPTLTHHDGKDEDIWHDNAMMRPRPLPLLHPPRDEDNDNDNDNVQF